jgi:Mg2+-importing ATPase
MKMEQEPLAALYAKFKTSEAGLTNEEAERRLAEVGPNEPAHERRVGGFFQFVRFFANPLVIILLIASAVSAGVGELINASIIAGMVLLSVALNVIQT